MEPKCRWICRALWFAFDLLICSCLSLSICQIAEARLGPSPAGGNYLWLDDEHDFVSTIEEWLPDERFEELTIEAWIHIEELPDPGTFWSIVCQASRFNFPINSEGWLGVFVDADGGACKGFTMGSIRMDKWVHVAIFCNAGAGGGYNGSGCICGGFGGNLRTSDDYLRIGGIMPKETGARFLGENVKLRGYIDEVRISSVLRYPRVVGSFDYDVPEERFETDEDTLCLWHFDEDPIATRYKDSSGNDYHLWRSGVIAPDPFIVESEGKVSITWGQLKESVK